MSLLKSIAVPTAIVGAICLGLAASAPANAQTAANAYARSECDRRVREGSIRFQSQYDNCLRSTAALGGALFGGNGNPADAFLDGFNEALGGGLF